MSEATLNDSQMNFCAVHPQRDTELRCNRCERYMLRGLRQTHAGGLYLPRMRTRA